MSLRSAVPSGLHEASRHAYISLGALTASARLEPSFIMVGASRSGTTSLFRALSSHPLVFRPTVNKGVRYFDLNAHRSRAWYLGHFPVRRTAELRTRHVEGGPVSFEASGYYSFHPFAVPRIAAMLPDVRLVMMLRDPVERAHSAWKHELARGFEWEDFEPALELEDERLRGEVERMAHDPAYESFSHRHHSHRARGEYADQLQRMFDHLPREQVHVVVSEAFFTEPEKEYARVLDFLGLPQKQPPSFPQHNAEPRAPMSPAVRRRLEEHYAPFNDRLEQLLDRPLRWS